MIRVTGGYTKIQSQNAVSITGNNQIIQGNETTPNVCNDYACTRMENLTFYGDTCTCDITSADEAAIAGDPNYTIE